MTADTWRKSTAEDAVRVDVRLHWAKYDFAGARIAQGEGSCAPTEDEVNRWDADAPVKVAEIKAQHDAEVAERKALEGTRVAKYPGRCALSGKRYNKGARIRQTAYGWVLAGVELDLTYQMDRADSPF